LFDSRQGDRLLHYHLFAGALLLNSRVVSRLGRAVGLRVPPVIIDSDLTAELFEHWIALDELITIIGTTA
jgi:hypothetical protein